MVVTLLIFTYFIMAGITGGLYDALATDRDGEPVEWTGDDRVALVAGVIFAWPVILAWLLADTGVKGIPQLLETQHARKLELMDRSHEHQMKQLAAAKDISTD